ncbi:MAG: hypothetical protein ABIG93_03220 [archaeon]|nr:hypothetical protein [Nanoarchaeota archaeon]
MQEIMRKSLLKDLNRAISILETREIKDIEELKELSDHTIKDVTLYKNMDAISLAVLIYSIYKVSPSIQPEDYKKLFQEMKNASKNLGEKQFGRYNSSMKIMFDIIKKCSDETKTHVQDVLQAARIKKSTTLLEHGMSVARAAELMGISRWDILQYAGGTRLLEKHKEKVSATTRLQQAIKIFSGQSNSKIIFFDAGPIITLAMSRLLWILKPLKEKFGGKFYITTAVHKEIIETPVQTKRFKFEALQVIKLIKDGIIEPYNHLSNTRIQYLAKLSNQTYKINNKPLEIIQAGEMETVLASLSNNKAPIIMDERTMRLLIENGKSLKSLLEHRTKKKVDMNIDNVKKFQNEVGTITIIRSVELAAVAFKLGILDDYLPKSLPNPKETLLDSVLWDTKFNGSAATDNEVLELKEFLLGR